MILFCITLLIFKKKSVVLIQVGLTYFIPMVSVVQYTSHNTNAETVL